MVARTDEVYVGRDYGAREIEITPELVRHYAESVDDHNPWYFGETPLGGAVAPALVLHSEVYRDIAWYLPNLYGNLHAKQEWELFEPVMVGDVVVARRLIIDRYRKRDREYVVNEVSVSTLEGRLLSRSRTHQSFLADKGTTGVVVDKEREKRKERRFEVEGAEALEEISGPEKTATVEMCLKFSGPHKNYHNDIEEAKRLGFPDIVVQGMMSLCFLSEMMTARYGLGWLAGGRMSVNLVNVLWGRESARCRGLVTEATPEGKRERAQLQVWCEKGDGTKVTVGSASALLV